MSGSTHNGEPIGVRFVCLGNICRSPLAKWIFTDLAERRSVRERFEIDSCGTGHWHVGKGADPRSTAVAMSRGIQTPHTARRLAPAIDFVRFRYLLAMDTDNRDAMLHAGAPADRVFLMRSFDPTLTGEPDHRLVVPDPYYGGPEGFDHVYDMLHAACSGFLEHALAEQR
ncbi:MAG: low molecular weight protein-tyrosine-phosphatase [Phycisphaerae bacterium]